MKIITRITVYLLAVFALPIFAQRPYEKNKALEIDNLKVERNPIKPKGKIGNLPVKTILTDNGRECCGTPNHPYELFLELSDIEHRKTQVRHPQTNGFVERFNRTVLDEFFRPAFRTKMYESVDSLQIDLDKWLKEYSMGVPSEQRTTTAPRLPQYGKTTNRSHQRIFEKCFSRRLTIH